MSLEQLGIQIGTGALIGYITGWDLKKLLRIVIKLVAIILAAFFGGLLWLERVFISSRAFERMIEVISPSVYSELKLSPITNVR